MMTNLSNIVFHGKALILAAALAVLASGCGGESGTPSGATAPAQSAATETSADTNPADSSQVPASRAQYTWYMEGATPAGQSVVVKTGDGHITSETFIHWNNREYTVKSEVQLDSQDHVLAQRVTGSSPFGAPIDESFSYDKGVATWSTVGQQGSAVSEEPAYYLSNEAGDFATLSALVRLGTRSLDGQVPMFPSGTAKVERVAAIDVETGTGKQSAALYAISGIDYTPVYAWFDQDLELVAIDQGGYLGMIPDGWPASALKQMSDAQTRESALRLERMATELSTVVEAPLIIENADLVDVEHGVLLPRQNVLVENGKIAAISDQPIARDDAVRIDATGHTLMPGLWDMHGHFTLADGVLNIAGGVTSVRDMGNVHEKMVVLAEKFDSGGVIGPHTYRAGFIDKAGPYASGWPAETLEDALGRVDFFAANGYIQIKLYSSIEPAWVAPIAARAHSLGLRVSGHIPAFMSAEQAIRAGYDEIQHINMVFLNFLAGDREDTRQQIRFTLYGDEAANLDLDSQPVNDFIQLLKDHGTVIDPTAAIFDTMLVHKPGVPDPTFAAVAEHLPAAVRRALYSPEMVLGPNWPASGIKQGQMLKKLYDNGIQLVPGSDGTPAFVLHRELEVYVEAGIPAPAVLKMATLDSARVAGVAEKTGSIAVGKDADLVLVDGNPLENISAVRNARLVLKGRTAYRPDDLYEAVGVQPFLPSIRWETAPVQP